MGTTLTALQAGSCNYKWIAAIEGVSYLLTDATTTQATNAWTGLDVTSALHGLFVELQNEQRINPWEPLTGAGKLTLRMKQDASDTFGIDVTRKSAGAETALTATIDRNDTTIPVKSTTNFDASGTIYIGTECITYSGVTATSFTGCTRGMYHPFGTGVAPTVCRFGQHHRVTVTSVGEVNILPRVSSQPRVWIGKAVGLWMHRNVGGTLDLKAEAQLVFAGRIVEIRDDPATLCTVVEVEHVQDYVKKASLGGDAYTATFEEGVYIGRAPGQLSLPTFELSDTRDNWATQRDADPLTVVESGASGFNEMNAGMYTIAELISIFNSWLANELDAARCWGRYTMTIRMYDVSEGSRTYIGWSISGGTAAAFRLTLPPTVALFFGWGGQNDITDAGSVSNDHAIHSPKIPYRSLLDGSEAQRPYGLTDERGTFADQSDNIPGYSSTFLDSKNAGAEWGVFLLDNKLTGIMAYDSADSTVSSFLQTSFQYIASSEIAPGDTRLVNRGYDDETGEAAIRQIFALTGTRATIIKQIFYSTGAAGYNHATYDVLPFTISLGIPGSMLGAAFEASIDALPGADDIITVVIDEPVKFEEQFAADLIIELAFMRWKNQGLEFCTWKTPTTGDALTEANKASPSGNKDEQRSATIETDEWQKTTIKLDYDRDITSSEKNAGYRSSDLIINRTAIDDAGGAEKLITLKLRNTYGAAGMGDLKQRFMAGVVRFTFPIRKTSRTIDMRFFEGHAVGDCVIVTDLFARDPDTGVRGVGVRPGIIIAHRWSPGGLLPNSKRPNDILGEVEIMFQDALRVAPYVPCADVDDTAATGGYVAGTKTVTCYAHRYSESSESADASYMSAGRKVRVTQRDPADPAAPLTWDDVVVSQTGNTIVLTTGLAGWVSTNRYRVVWDTYGDVVTAQQAYSYQADDADERVADARAPFQYVKSAALSGSYTANTAADQIELPANNSYGDGVAHDLGHDIALNRLHNNLIDYKTAHSAPFMNGTKLTGSGATGTYKLVSIEPIHLTSEQHTDCPRVLSVAPHFASADGSSQSVRVTLSKAPGFSPSVNDVSLGAQYGSQVFTTSSTTFATPTAATIDIGTTKSLDDGIAFILIECTELAETYGLAVCQEGPRT